MSVDWESTNQVAARAEWAVAQEGVFKPGFKFDVPMTYKEMREFVKSEHRKLGGDGLTVKARYKRGNQVPHHVVFKCSHGRKHPNQVGHKPIVSEDSKRADRSSENRRVLYTECPFHFCIRLDPNFVLIQPQPVASEDLESDGDEDDEDKKQHKNRGNNSSIKAQWLVDDGISKKKRSGKDAEPLCCMTHAGHIQRTLQVGQMTQVIRDYIEEHSRASVNVPSLQQLIERKFNVCMFCVSWRYSFAFQC